MARSLPTEVTDALAARALVARDFLWFVARDSDGNPVTDGMWSDVGTVSAQVVNPDTGDADTRSFFGSGTLIQIDDIPLVANLTVQNVSIRMSQVEDHLQQLVRDYDVRQARVEIYRGLFDPVTRLLVSPATCRFVGFVDKVEIDTPAENDDGAVILTCASHTQEMTRSNPDTRSDASQRLRSATDDFFVDTAVVGTWQQSWGRTVGTIVAAPVPGPQRSIFGWGR